MECIENRTFDEIQIGDSASIERRLTWEDIKLFAVMSGNVGPVHLDEDFAKNSRFHEIVAHGMWGGSLLSTVIGTRLPGPGTIYLGQTLRFLNPVRLGDVLTVTVTAKQKDAAKHRVIFDCRCTNAQGDAVITGEADVIAPVEKVKRPRIVLPEVRLTERTQLDRLLQAAKEREPIRMAVVHPCDAPSLGGAVQAASNGLIHPILVGPENKIHAVAETQGFDLSPYEIVSTAHSHEAAAQAVAMARSGKVDGLMKGRLHTEELMHEIIKRSSGLRTERQISHIFAFDVPTYPRPILMTDAAINIYPNLEQKRDIVQNVIDLAHALQIERPKVAILSAVETVTPKIESTLDAAALCKMADRGQITGGLVDGPLAFDNAVSEAAAATKGIVSPVAGKADILVAPDLESGNMLAKQLDYLADAVGAGIVLGARVPIVLTSRADDALERMAACALALLWRDRQREISV